jgi:hypothetical protein
MSSVAPGASQGAATGNDAATEDVPKSVLDDVTRLYWASDTLHTDDEIIGAFAGTGYEATLAYLASGPPAVVERVARALHDSAERIGYRFRSEPLPWEAISPDMQEPYQSAAHAALAALAPEVKP